MGSRARATSSTGVGPRRPRPQPRALHASVLIPRGSSPRPIGDFFVKPCSWASGEPALDAWGPTWRAAGGGWPWVLAERPGCPKACGRALGGRVIPAVAAAWMPGGREGRGERGGGCSVAAPPSGFQAREAWSWRKHRQGSGGRRRGAAARGAHVRGRPGVRMCSF